MRRATLPFLLVVMTAMGTAAGPAFLDVGTGMVSPNSPFYGVEVALDRAVTAVGLADPDRVVQERAAEALAMARRNNTAGMLKAAGQVERMAQHWSTNETTGLARAALILQAIRDDTTTPGQQGIDRALQRIRALQDPALERERRRQLTPPTGQG